MRFIAISILCVGLLAGCTSSTVQGEGLSPIPGSIIYKGQPHSRLTRSPVGSTFPHGFTDEWGRRVEETYIIRPDRTLAIVNRQYLPDVSRNN
ncbi:hypothetical protein FHX08_006359 [Rhizobium sp. BK529]|uniref:hypothetical protein n=1 Tax=Rhizobium sp. BK529 TaxID=2586983 RepID=UPI0016165DC4|nr:hypothetical protein [Rhizobium sp. BK529]MBB3595939.1 hypothetical protein [Rhizobium sp. BK529]